MRKPLCIDLYCGLGGWAEGFIAEGYEVIGFDIERHRYLMPLSEPSAIKRPGLNWSDRSKRGSKDAQFNRPPKATDEWMEYPGHLALQDVLTLHGSQFRDAAVIVASPPCQEYSYRAMPWKRAKAMPPPSNELFEACFRIQREACESARRYIPLVVENVCGAQRWVGRAKWHYGSYYLWGDVPALMPVTLRSTAVKTVGHVNKRDGYGHTRHLTNQAETDAVKFGGGWWHDATNNLIRKASSRSRVRKVASAMIAKIPFELARHIARVYYPDSKEEQQFSCSVPDVEVS